MGTRSPVAMGGNHTMACQEHLDALMQCLSTIVGEQLAAFHGAEGWRKWRETVKGEVDLSGASLAGVDLRGFDLSGCNLTDCNLRGTQFQRANLREARLPNARMPFARFLCTDLAGADLTDCYMHRAEFHSSNLTGAQMLRVYAEHAVFNGSQLNRACLVRANLISATMISEELMGKHESTDCDLSDADLTLADLTDANLDGAILRRAQLRKTSLNGARCLNADFTGANLSGADLSQSVLVEANLTDAQITGAQIYGVSAWNVNLTNTQQHDLIISKWNEPILTVDDLEVGQFIYLMLNNTKIRNVIDTITSKGVLILGRFSDPQRKAVLDGLKDGLRRFNLLPMVFDFDRPTDKDYTETVQTLVGMSMFVIADVTLPKSTPLELEATVKQFKVPYLPIIDLSVDPRPFAMLVDSQKSFHWVLSTLAYGAEEELLDADNLKTFIIDRAMAKREELRRAKNEEPEMLHIPRRAAGDAGAL